MQSGKSSAVGKECSDWWDEREKRDLKLFLTWKVIAGETKLFTIVKRYELATNNCPTPEMYLKRVKK